MSKTQMVPYHELLSKILKEGVLCDNRTGTPTLSVFGETMKFDMKDGFPAPTTKKLAFKSMLGELLGFFRAYDSAAQFRQLGCKVWDANANVTPSWLANPNRKGEDDLGQIYGKIWTEYEDLRVVLQEEVSKYAGAGYEVLSQGGVNGAGLEVATVRKKINQVEQALKDILLNPGSRRIIVTGWRPDFFDRMALPPCHVDYMFMVDQEKRELHLSLWQRSYDAPLGFNIQIGALFLEIMAQFTNLKPGVFTHFVSNAHVYVNQIDGVNLMLSRDHLESPQLQIDQSVCNYEQFKDIVENASLSACEKSLALDSKIKGVFERLEPEHFKLLNYVHHEAIKFPFAS